MKVKMKGRTLKQLLLTPNSGGYSAYAVPNSGQYSESWTFLYSILYIIHGKGTNSYCYSARLCYTVFWHLVHYSVLYSSCRILYIILMCGFVHYSEPYSRTIFCTVFYARGCVICFIPYSGLILRESSSQKQSFLVRP